MVYQQDMPVEQLVMQLCDVKQGYTQYGGRFDVMEGFTLAPYTHIHH